VKKKSTAKKLHAVYSVKHTMPHIKMKPHFHMLALCIFACLLLLGLTACKQTGINDGISGTYPVDSTFREYYRDLGGEERFGPAISQSFDRDKYECQYTVNALLCYDPLATGSARFFLAPLGTNLILDSDTNLISSAIYPDFLPLYKELNNFNAVGNSLTGVIYNSEKQRVEQYFENVGFYHRFDDPHGVVLLLPYGDYFCASDCSYNGVNAVDQISPQYSDIVSPFGSSLDQIGGTQAFGRPLTRPYETEDGFTEQVYENVIVFAPTNQLANIHLRPLPEMLELESAPPGPKVYGDAENMVFYTTAGELGYHVPKIFDRFISQHGGLQISGNPIADPYRDPQTNIPRQCYQNYCLEYHSEAEQEYQTRMATLGTLYMEQNQEENALISRYVYSTNNVQMSLSEQQPQVTSNEDLIVNVLVQQSENQTPIANVETKVTLTYPNGEQESFVAAATNSLGQASVTMPAQKQLTTGDMVSYKICLNVPSEQPICVYDSFLVWNLE
jgi:hypothetical protein